ncbi:hypothetical protein EW145_g4983 [Phellinidium pouzarii]|uniref:ATP phosphoribosyltransferase n=1 Tax=Phellinidium pouzarii TaxID=167371 RepID=A0A4S4L1L1_9AGAM|nr:hypothetical protein EW145_g4983 [Phellinidium pouzarii]
MLALCDDLGKSVDVDDKNLERRTLAGLWRSGALADSAAAIQPSGRARQILFEEDQLPIDLSDTMSRFKLIFFCPIKNTSDVLDHLFNKYPKHIGHIGEYECCAFMAPGIGQFRPVGSAKPVIGEAGRLEKVDEHRVEVVVRDEGEDKQIRGAVNELKKAHPYEEVAYEVYRIENI